MKSPRAALVASAALFAASPTFAQFGGSPVITGGSFTAGGTANQIQYYGTNGQFAGFTMSGDCTVTVATGVLICGAPYQEKQTFFTSTTGSAALNIPQGVTPTSPANGDVWTTSSGMFAQIAGSTVGPFGAGGSGCTVSGTANQMISNTGSSGCQSSTATLTTAGAIGSLLDLDFSGTTAACTAATNGFHVTAANTITTCINGTATGVQTNAIFISPSLTFNNNMNAAGTLVLTHTAPSAPGAGCGSTTAFSNTTSTLAVDLTIGGTGITATCQFTLPAASHGWHCWGDDLTTLTEVLHQTVSATNSATMVFYAITTGLATAPTTGDLVKISCAAN